MTILLFVSTIAFIAIWLVGIHAMGITTRLYLARKPWLFLLIHIPIMYGTTFIGGEGLLIAVSSIFGGVVGQMYLQIWGMKHGLTFMGKRTPKYYKLHPKRKSLLSRIDSKTRGVVGRVGCSPTSPSSCAQSKVAANKRS